MVLQGWDRERAIDEMINGGYGFHPIWTEIPRFLREVDTAAIRAALRSRGIHSEETGRTGHGQIKMD
jgi:hypothetical protein